MINRTPTGADARAELIIRANAEEVFLSDSSATELENAIADLQRGVSGLEISSEGSIACVLFDAQAKVRAGSTFKIRYTLAENSTDYKYIVEFLKNHFLIIGVKEIRPGFQLIGEVILVSISDHLPDIR